MSMMMKNLKIFQVFSFLNLVESIEISVDDDFEEVPEKKKELKFETVSKDKMPVAPVYMIEYFLGACLAGYIVNYILGRVSNGSLAQRWFDAAESFLVSFLAFA